MGSQGRILTEENNPVGTGARINRHCESLNQNQVCSNDKNIGNIQRLKVKNQT